MVKCPWLIRIVYIPVEVTFRDEAELPECAKEEDALVGGSNILNFFFSN